METDQQYNARRQRAAREQKLMSEMTHAEFERWLKRNKITGLAAASAERKWRHARTT